MKENILAEKSLAFAVRIAKLYSFLENEKREYIMSKQALKSGTSIGANVNEAQYGQSRADFTSKMNIALKEAAETEYWIKVLAMSGYIDEKIADSLVFDCLEIKRLLASTVKTAKEDR